MKNWFEKFPQDLVEIGKNHKVLKYPILLFLFLGMAIFGAADAVKSLFRAETWRKFLSPFRELNVMKSLARAAVWRRIGAFALVFCMVFTLLPAPAFAEVLMQPQNTPAVCEHHAEHTAECGFVAATAEIPCAHEHTADCGSAENLCPHNAGVHDETCGYAAATEGAPCTFVCEICSGAAVSDAVKAVQALIEALPTIDELSTVDTEGEGFAAYIEMLRADVLAARTAFDALTEEDKAAFDAVSLEKLTALEDVLAGMPMPMAGDEIPVLGADGSHENVKYILTTDSPNTAAISGVVSVSAVTGVNNVLVIPAQVQKDSITYSVTEISEYAFRNCTGLTTVTIPSSVTTIERAAFQKCTQLVSVTIPDSVTVIGDYAFDACTSLAKLTIPSSVTTIGGQAFTNMKPGAVVTLLHPTLPGGSGFNRSSFLTGDNSYYYYILANPAIAKAVGDSYDKGSNYGIFVNEVPGEFTAQNSNLKLTRPLEKASGSVTARGYNVLGVNGGGDIGTTYNGAGYPTYLSTDAVPAFNNSSLVRLPGKGAETYAKSGIWVTTDGEFVSGEKYLRVTYTLRNSTASPINNVSLGVAADTMIGSDDTASIFPTPTGFRMVNTKDAQADPTAGGMQFTLNCKNAPGADDVSTMWYGKWAGDFRDNVFTDLAEKADLVGNDSVITFSWKGMTIPANGRITRSVVFGVSEAAAPPVLPEAGSKPIALYLTTEGEKDITVNAKVTDAAGLTDTLYYTINDGAEQALGETVVADGSTQKVIAGVIGADNFNSDGEYTVKLWIMNSKGAMSEVITKVLTVTSGAMGGGGLETGTAPVPPGGAPECTCLAPAMDVDWQDKTDTEVTFPALYGYTIQSLGAFGGSCAIAEHRSARVTYTYSFVSALGGNTATVEVVSDEARLTFPAADTYTMKCVAAANGKETSKNATFTLSASAPKITIEGTCYGDNMPSTGGDSLQDAVTKAITGLGSLAQVTKLEITAGEVTTADWEWFNGSGVPVLSKLTDFTIADAPAVTSVAEIVQANGDDVFFPMSIVNVSIPQAIAIGDNLFERCAELQTASIPAATSIGTNAFLGCIALTSANFPTVASIGDFAFSGCKVLTEVNILNATSIGKQAFTNCTALTTASFPLVTTIGNGAFNGCSALQTASFSSVKTIEQFGLNNCTSLATLKLPAAVPTVADVNAFLGCKKTTLTLMDASGTPLADAALAAAAKAYDEVADGIAGSTATDGKWYGWKVREPIVESKITIEGTCNGDNMLSTGGTSLEDAVTKAIVGFGTLAQVTKLEITKGEVTTADWTWFKGTGPTKFPALTDFTIDAGIADDKVADIPDITSGSTFPKSIQTVTIPQAIKIGEYAFSGCKVLTEVNILNATSIGRAPFKNCDALTTANFPLVTSIGNYAFESCDALTSLSVPKVTDIGKEAFNECVVLGTLKLPATPPTAGEQIFFMIEIKPTITLVNGSGTPLEGAALAAAAKAYDEVADGIEGSTGTDGLWYGAKVREAVGFEPINGGVSFEDGHIYANGNALTVIEGKALEYTNIYYTDDLAKKPIDLSAVDSPDIEGSAANGYSLFWEDAQSGSYTGPWLFGGSKSVNVGDVKLTLEGGWISTVCGSGGSIDSQPSNATVGSITINSKAIIAKSLYAAGLNGKVTGDITVNVTGGRVSNLWGYTVGTVDQDASIMITITGGKLGYVEVPALTIGGDVTVNPDNYTGISIKGGSQMEGVESFTIANDLTNSDGVGVNLPLGYAGGIIATEAVAGDLAKIKLVGDGAENAVATLDGTNIVVTVSGVDPIPVTGVTLDKSTLSLEVGKSGTLTANITPPTATNKAVTWESSNTAVATVTNGLVKAVTAGTATIIVTTADGGKSATCAVTVTAKTAGTAPGGKLEAPLTQDKIDEVFGEGNATLDGSEENPIIKIENDITAETPIEIGVTPIRIDLGGSTITGADGDSALEKGTTPIVVDDGISIIIGGGGTIAGGDGGPGGDGADGIIGGSGSVITIGDGVTVIGGDGSAGGSSGSSGGDGIHSGGDVSVKGDVEGGNGSGGASGGDGGDGVDTSGGTGTIGIGSGGTAQGGDGGSGSADTGGNGGNGTNSGSGGTNINGGGSSTGGKGGNGTTSGGDGGSGAANSSNGDISVIGDVKGGEGGNASGGEGGRGGNGTSTGGDVDISGGSSAGGDGGNGTDGGNGGSGTSASGGVEIGSGGSSTGGNGGTGGNGSGGTGGDGADVGGDTTVGSDGGGGSATGGDGGNGTTDGGDGGNGTTTGAGDIIVDKGGSSTGGDGGNASSGTGGNGGNGADVGGGAGSVDVSDGTTTGGTGGNGSTAGGNGGNGTSSVGGDSTTIDGGTTGGNGGNGTGNGDGGNGGDGANQGGGTVEGGGSATGGDGGTSAGAGSGGQGGSGVGGGASAGNDLITKDGISAKVEVIGDADVKVELPDAAGAVDAVLTEEEKADNTITGVKVTLEVNDKTAAKPDSGAVDDVKPGGSTVGAFFDITLKKTITTGSGSEDFTMTETQGGKKITITIEIPANMRGGSDYVVIRVHDGRGAKLATTQNGNILTFETDKFSTYAIAYTKAGGGTDPTPPVDGGSGNGGNSGGGGYTPPVVTTPSDKPNTPVTVETEVRAEVDEKGNATVRVPQDVVEDAVKKAGGKTENGIAIVINVSTGGKNATSMSVNLPKTTQEYIIKSKISQFILVMKNPEISIGLDLAAVTEINRQAKSDVNLIAVRKDGGSFTGSAKAVIGARSAFDISVSYGGKNVENFGRGRAAIAIPYTLAAGENAGYLQAVFVNEKGTALWVKDSVYDSAAKVLRLGTNRFSTYGIGYRAANTAFTDIAGHFAKNDIDFAISRGLLAGTSAKTFAPNAAVTRGVFVAALGRFSGIDSTKFKNTTFTDVKADDYYAPYTAWAASRGIMSGTSATTFAPNQAITRQEMAVIMENYAKAMSYRVPKNREAAVFADNGIIASRAAASVKNMQQAGIIVGKNGNKFDPAAIATRAEASAILRRYLELTIDRQTAQGWETNDSGAAMYYQDGRPAVGRKIIGGIAYNFGADGICSKPDTAPPETKKYITYKIARGDTLWALSRKYSCTVAEIVELSGIKDPNNVPVGTEIKIPQR